MELIILVGPQGAGKSTYYEKNYRSYYYINQDTQGKTGHKKFFKKALEARDNIIVDRINHLRIQRARYIEPAERLGYTVKIVVFKVPKSECLERMGKRRNHPTIAWDAVDIQMKALNMFFRDYEPPTACEGELEFLNWEKK